MPSRCPRRCTSADIVLSQIRPRAHYDVSTILGYRLLPACTPIARRQRRSLERLRYTILQRFLLPPSLILVTLSQVTVTLCRMTSRRRTPLTSRLCTSCQTQRRIPNSGMALAYSMIAMVPSTMPKRLFHLSFEWTRVSFLDASAISQRLTVFVLDLDFDKANEILFRLGIIYKQQGKYEESLACFDRILRNPPSPLAHADIWFQIGHVYEQQKDVSISESMF